MHVLVETLQKYPEIAIFLALALGFFIGPLRLGKFSLGNVTGVLLAGVLIGQLHITISPNVKSVFFLMFLFAVGYDVGPQFFRGLKSDGLPQVCFAVVLCVACLLAAFVAARLAGYNIGQAAGLLSGACTISAVLGVATDTINHLGLPPEHAQAMINAMPVAYAVTYFFGTAGSAWFLASIGPKLLGVDLAKECKEYEAKLGSVQSEEGGITTYPIVALRAYKVAAGSRFAGQRLADLEDTLATTRRAYVERVRRGGQLLDAEPDMVIRSGDVLALAAPREALLQHEADLGAEVDDRELLSFPAEVLDVVITNKALAGKTLRQIADADGGQRGHGVFLRKLIRQAQEMPFTPGTTVDRGDVLQIAGARRDVERVVTVLGYPDRPTERTDVVFMGLGIVLGALFGAITIAVGGYP
jgi:putative transport protein